MKKKYIKDGVFFNGNTIEYNNMVIYRPDEETLLKAGYVEYVEPEPTPEELAERERIEAENRLKDAKAAKFAEIDAYDTSDAVNSFTMNGTPMWLPLEERKSMRQSLIALKAEDIITFTYWLGLTPITMEVSQFEDILNKLELYAIRCYNVTAQHKARVLAMDTTVEVELYDITTDYPAKLVF